MPRFDDAIAAAVRLRNSVSAEVVLFIVVCVLGAQVVLREYLALDAGTWYATPGASGSTLTPAGVWYGYVSLPLFQFLLLRWYFRMLIWFQLMWRLSRIELHFVPTHPDQRAGLAFLGTIAASFAPLAVAHGALLAGHLASRIFHLGASLPEFKLEIAVMVVFMLLLALGPLLLFMPQLWRAKLQGERDYGALAQRYVNEFDSKWLRGATPPDEPLIGSADIQSLADLNNSFQTVRGMHVLPFGKDAILQLAIATIVPVAPLVLTMMPLDELAKRLFSVLF
jgi:hypothetical protein